MAGSKRRPFTLESVYLIINFRILGNIWNRTLLLTSETVQNIVSITEHCLVLTAEEVFPVLHTLLGSYSNYVYYVIFFSLTLLLSLMVRHLIFLFKTNENKNSADSVFNYTVFDLAKTAYEPGHMDAVIHLIEKLHYDVNFCIPSNGLSLFLCACLSGQKKLVEYMLENGADVHVITKEGDGALYLATFGLLSSKNPDFTVIEMLMKHGCSINAQNSKCYTPLHRAASKGNCKLINYLLKLGADPYLCSTSGIYPIDSAINLGHIEAAELLKIHISNPHVWDVVEPHTPPRIQLGLQSPRRRHLIESSRQKTVSRIIT